MYATISADIVSSTSLSMEETIMLKHKIQELLHLLEKKYPQFWGRLIKGDYIECLIPNVPDAFRVALIIKSYIKSLQINENKQKKDFVTYGVRIAVGIGSLRIVDKEHGIIDGEAIYLSGRSIEGMSSLNKGTLTVNITNSQLDKVLSTIAVLTDALMNNTTQRQSEVLFYKLLGMKEVEIANKMGISQAGINKHSTASKWYCIEEALHFFEHINFEEYE